MNDFNNIKYINIENNKKINTIILPGYLQTYKSYECLFDTIGNYSNIYILEFPGFGITEKLDYVVNLDYYVLLLRDFIKVNKLQNIVLLGHSFGGRIIAKYESLYNDSLSIILIDSAGIKRRSIKNMFKIYAYKFKKKLYKMFNNKKKYKELLLNSGSNDYKQLDIISRQTFNNIIKEDTRKYLKKIRTLSFIIWGKLDKETPLKLGKITNKLIKNSTLIEISDVGHFPHLEKPELINQIINCYYKDVIISFT